MKLSEAKIGRVFICSLDYDSDLYDSIEKLVQKHEIKNAWFWAIGALRKARISFYDQIKQEYQNLVVDKKLEIVSCTGNIAGLKDHRIIHAHVSLADSKGKSYGGHLISGCSIFATELFLIELNGLRLERLYDAITGLNLLNPHS